VFAGICAGAVKHKAELLLGTVMLNAVLRLGTVCHAERSEASGSGFFASLRM